MDDAETALDLWLNRMLMAFGVASGLLSCYFLVDILVDGKLTRWVQSDVIDAWKRRRAEARRIEREVSQTIWEAIESLEANDAE